MREGRRGAEGLIDLNLPRRVVDVILPRMTCVMPMSMSSTTTQKL
jgi:hypothetical protein